MINREKIPLAQNDHKSGISKLGPISPKMTTSRISRFRHFFYHTSKFRTILHKNNGAYTNQTWLLDQKQVVENSEKNQNDLG